ncbi:MAG: hypothetical protein F4Y87_04695 [Synechococcus sp. SB0665_bin_28]|nr:hypothetical protein [Synechococcus sp. SB0665_bin_28]MYF19977.1 hypothetical protein [Synechococcus sp. SB0677_bin_5]
MTTALVGADWRTERWRAGAVISHSWGSGSYEAEGESSGDRDGDSSSTMTGLFPYGRYGITPRLGIWAVAGLWLGPTLPRSRWRCYGVQARRHHGHGRGGPGWAAHRWGR